MKPNIQRKNVNPYETGPPSWVFSFFILNVNDFLIYGGKNDT